MYPMRFLALMMIASTSVIIACADEPVVITDPDISGAVLESAQTGIGPFLLQVARDAGEPAFQSCAEAVSDEGVIAGWSSFGMSGPSSSTITALTVWDRRGKLTMPGLSIPDRKLAILDMNNRGQVLARVFAARDFPPTVPEDVLVIDPDGTVEAPVPSYSFGYLLETVGMDRTGHVLVSYLRSDCGSTPDPCTDEVVWIEVTGRGKLEPSHESEWSWRPSECSGEVIDDNGTVYGRCYIEGDNVHFRWPDGNGPEVYPPNAIDLVNVEIVDVNRYGEAIGAGGDLGIVFWSPSTGRTQLPQVPRVSFGPVALNDPGVVLLAGDYWDGIHRPVPWIAYWTLSGGITVLPKKGWPHVEVHDINNQGVIVGCVGGDGGKDLVPAYWRVR